MVLIKYLNSRFEKIKDVLFQPTHPASLAFARILFGLLMMLDIPEERGGSYIDQRWGDPMTCHFPLFSQLKPLNLKLMCVIYGFMWLGALGICLGYKFKIACLAFSLPYWYIFLLDKSFWNNHSYLYGLVSLLFLVSSANKYWSVDSYLSKRSGKNGENSYIPYWNYFLLKFQFFILYFFAGLKKTDMEWLDGYSMAHLGSHWVFEPFSFILTFEQIDYLIIHCSGFLLDLTVGFFLIYNKTRPLAMIFCAMFHLMNTRLFSIGMFPYVCLATMPLFCEPDWPLQLLNKIKSFGCFAREKVDFYNFSKKQNHKAIKIILISFYCALQMFLPYSHFITKGFNNWTNGLYGYSWDMMVHSWDTTLVVIRVVDNKSGEEYFLDPNAWTENTRWSTHADMGVQYAQCLKNNLLSGNNIEYSNNISIYFDVWCSLNGRFQQRMFDPNYDMLKAKWSPFEPVEWLLPLLTEYNDLRTKIKEIQEHVYSWSNYSDVLFVADFPNLSLENYISAELSNITLTVIDGDVYYENEDESLGVKLSKDQNFPIIPDVFHTIRTISQHPSCFMYTYLNKSRENVIEGNDKKQNQGKTQHSSIPLLEDKERQFSNLFKMFELIGESLYDLFMY